MEEANNNLTQTLFFHMKDTSTKPMAYLTSPNKIMEHEHAIDRFKTEMLVYNTKIDSIDMQILKYVMKLSFTDIDILTKYARFRASIEKDKNIFTDPDLLQERLRNLKKVGLILVKKYHTDPLAEDGKEERQDCKDWHTFYFLSAIGARMLKEKTKEDDFIEEYLSMKTDNEVMSRCAVNNIILDTAPYFPTRFFRVTSTFSMNKMARQVLYGSLENDENIVLYEAVFYGDDMNMVTEEAQDRYINKRDIFLSAFFSQEKYANKEKTLVMVLETANMAEKSYKLYKRTVSVVNSVYIITESGIDYVTEKLGEKTINAYVSFSFNESTGKISGSKKVPKFLMTKNKERQNS